eukprot:3463096-Rhodomonas_salina.1
MAPGPQRLLRACESRDRDRRTWTWSRSRSRRQPERKPTRRRSCEAGVTQGHTVTMTTGRPESV